MWCSSGQHPGREQGLRALQAAHTAGRRHTPLWLEHGPECGAGLGGSIISQPRAGNTRGREVNAPGEYATLPGGQLVKGKGLSGLLGLLPKRLPGFHPGCPQ